MSSNSEYEQRRCFEPVSKIHEDMLRLIKETPDQQKEDGILWVAQDIYDELGENNICGLPVLTNRLIGKGEAFIAPSAWLWSEYKNIYTIEKINNG